MDYNQYIKNLLVRKCFQISGLHGDYLEFGTYMGNSLADAYWAAHDICQEFITGCWEIGEGESAQKGSSKEFGRQSWEGLRFIGFDSFEGIPEIGDIDSFYPIFTKGAYKTAEEAFWGNLKQRNIDLNKVKVVKGFFNESLTSDTADKLNIKMASVIYIDSDIYESARLALDFCTPFLRDGTTIIFDEWYQFQGNPYLGEQRAFNEWRDNHPEWIVTQYHSEGAFRQAFILSKKPNL